MRLVAFCLTLILGTVSAEDFSPDVVRAVTELNATYAKLDGFIAVYRYERTGKTLETTVAMDKFSGLSVVDGLEDEGGRKLEFQIWNTEDDVLYMKRGPGIARVEGIGAEIKSLNEFNNLANPGDKMVLTTRLTPCFFFDRSTIEIGLFAGNSDLPGWGKFMDGAIIKEQNDKTITFLTKENGRILVDRSNGIMSRQILENKSGEPRVIELKSIEINPGGDRIRDISKARNTEGAILVNHGSYTADFRLKSFQGLITAVEQNKLDLGNLQTIFDAQQAVLRNFVHFCVTNAPGSASAAPLWKDALDQTRENLRKKYREVQGDKYTDESFEQMLQLPEVRETARDQLVIVLAPERISPELTDQAHDKAMKEIFGNNDDPKLQAKTETGKAAKLMIEAALFRAYCGAVLEQKIKRYWSPGGDID